MQKLASSSHSRFLRHLNVVGRLFLFSPAATDATATQSPSPCPGLMAEYLVSTLGFSAQKAAEASHLLRRVKSSGQPDSVLGFFRAHGFEDAHLQKLVAWYPRWLALDVEKSLTPRFQAFQELGFSGDSLIDLVLSNPGAVMRDNLERIVVPKIKLWKHLLGSDTCLKKCFKERRWILGYSLEKTVLPNVSLLEACNLSDRAISLIVSKHPMFIVQKREALKELIDRAERLGVSRGSSNFHWVLRSLYLVKEENFCAKVEVMKSCGWSEDVFLAVFRRAPGFVTNSVKSLKEKMEFFVNDAGCTPSYVASKPSLLTLSLRKRLIPRLRVLKALKSKDLRRESNTLISVMIKTEKAFLAKYILPYAVEFPELSHVYTSSSEVDAA